MKSRNITVLGRSFEIVRLFNGVIDIIFKFLILFVVLVLGIGLFRLFAEFWSVASHGNLKESFSITVTNLLTFFIILELFKSLVEYFREHRLKLTFIVDATLVFILREVMVSLYQHQSSPLQLAALALLTLVLGCLRTLAIVYSPMERSLVEQLKQPSEANEVKPQQRSEAECRSFTATSPVH